MDKSSLRSLLIQIRRFVRRISYEDNNANSVSPTCLPFVDLCIYFTLLIVTVILTISTGNIGMHYFEKVVDRLFISRATYNDQGLALTFKDLVTVGDWWSFVQSTLIEGIAEFSPQDTTDSVSMKGYVLIGAPRLRQIRVRNETCTINESFRNEFQTCYGKYSIANEDKNEFLNKSHFRQSDINTYTVWGKIGSYFGGGYIEELFLQYEENEEFLEKLKDSGYIDRATRAILIEFVLFNGNVNIFCNVKLLTEIAPSGGVLTSSIIDPLMYSALYKGHIELICALVFFGIILLYTFKMALIVTVVGFDAIIRSMWNILDFFLVVFGYISLLYAIWYRMHLTRILERNTLNSGEYLSIDEICHWNMFFVTAMGTCVFIVWIKLFKYIQLNKTILQISTTLKRCGRDVLGFAVMFSIVLIAYANLSVLLFGTIHADFRDFPTAMLTMMRMVLGDFNYAEIEEHNAIIGPIYFLSYMLFVFFILLNMFLAIIIDTYSEVKAEITLGKGNNFVKYVKALLEKLASSVFPSKRNIKSEMKLEEAALPRAREFDLTNPEWTNTLDTWFEIISIEAANKEKVILNNRIKVLEETLEKLIKRLQEILFKMDLKAN